MNLPEHPEVLVGGKDARSDAILRGVAESPHEPIIYGMSEIHAPGFVEICAEFDPNVSLTSRQEMMRFARSVKPDLAIIGPEEPLGVGIVDALEEELDVPSFGPKQELAQIETSKSWARRLLDRYGVPGNPEYRVFHDAADLSSYFHGLGEFVIKPDGLTGGKGVKVFGEHLKSHSAALDYAGQLIDDDGLVLVEERLDGEEFSLQSITDGETVVHCPLVQDHKRAFEGDTGPNTGGMGSYSYPDHSLPFLSGRDVETAKEINERVVRALAEKTGRPYRGVLYGGFIATADGIKVIEYNARFGDPEALNVLPLLESDLLEICWATATGQLATVDVSFSTKATVCKYIVPSGYPSGKGSGDEIHVLTDGEGWQDMRLYWAAVNEVDSRIRLTGSRALAMVGIGNSLAEAEVRAEEATRLVQGNVNHRSDIGRQELVDRRIAHMRRLRGTG